MGAAAALATETMPVKRVIISKPLMWVITANKGGVGKTTLSFSLAIAAAYDGYKVAIIDLDEQHGSDFLNTVRRAKQPHLPQIDVHTYEFDEAEKAYKQVMAMGYDMVFIDCPPGVKHFTHYVKFLVDKADMVLVPTGTGILDLRACGAWLEELKPSKERDIAFILNLVTTGSISARDARNHVGKKGRVVDGNVRMLSAIKNGQKKGLTVFDTNKDEKADLETVWSWAKAEKGL